MVLESLFSARKIESKPIDMLILSIAVSFASVALAYLVFPEYAGIVFPLLITVGMAPIFNRIFSYEEREERKAGKESFLKCTKIENFRHAKNLKDFCARHEEIILLFSLFFVGVFISIFFIALVLPEEFSAMIKPQLDAIASVKPATGAAVSNAPLDAILFNNIKIIILSFVASVVFGVGSIWILAWNASVLGVYFASFLKKEMFYQFAAGSADLLPHVPLEFLAFFLGGIAGGFISVAIVKERRNKKAFLHVFKESMLLLALAIAVVFIAAFLEVYA